MVFLTLIGTLFFSKFPTHTHFAKDHFVLKSSCAPAVSVCFLSPQCRPISGTDIYFFSRRRLLYMRSAFYLFHQFKEFLFLCQWIVITVTPPTLLTYGICRVLLGCSLFTIKQIILNALSLMLIQPLIKAFLGNTVLATDHHPTEFLFLEQLINTLSAYTQNLLQFCY